LLDELESEGEWCLSSCHLQLSRFSSCYLVFPPSTVYIFISSFSCTHHVLSVLFIFLFDPLDYLSGLIYSFSSLNCESLSHLALFWPLYKIIKQYLLYLPSSIKAGGLYESVFPYCLLLLCIYGIPSLQFCNDWNEELVSIFFGYFSDRGGPRFFHEKKRTETIIQINDFG